MCNKRNLFQCINSGIESLDDLTNGWASGELTIFGTRPRMGKTSFVISCASNIVSEGIPIAFFSAVDKLDNSFLIRVAAAIKDEPIPYDDEKKRIMIEQTNFNDIPLYMYVNTQMSLAYIRRKLPELVFEKGVRCLFIETLQSLFVSEAKSNKIVKMADVCHELKVMAEVFRIPIIVTSELNSYDEELHDNDDPTPTMGDLECHCSIEGKVDNIYFLWRPEYYCIFKDKDGLDLKGLGEILIVKSRNDVNGTARVRYNVMKATIEDIAGNKRSRRKEELKRHNIVKEMRTNDAFCKLSDLLELEII